MLVAVRPLTPTIGLLAALAAPTTTWASAHEAARPPEIVEAAEAIRSAWQPDGAWYVSAARVSPAGGTRFGAMLTAAPGAVVRVQVRVLDGTPGPWIEAVERWSGGDDQRVLVADLGAWAGAAQVRLQAADFVDLGWRLLSPVNEAWEQPAPPADSNSSEERSVSQALLDIGVVPRETWGADATNCTSPESTWYRFAIHHTAGNTTSGGTVQGAVQGLQGWAMNSGGFCDIPYQFLVGYDGSLWEGRPLTYYSGATGAGNNDGNIAISHLGCFDSICSGNGDPAELIMRAGGRLLAQTLAAEHGIVTDLDTLRGHRDYPNQATACPGERIHDRLDEYRSSTAHFQGEVVATSWDGDLVLELGDSAALEVQIRNDGLETWTANTKLAPLPRDQPVALSADSWLSESRVSAPAADTPPGSVATFALDLDGAELGVHDLSFTLVEEAVAWFPDLPIGGGPAEGDLTLVVEVREEEQPTDPPPDDDDSADDDDATEEPVDPGPPTGGVRMPEFPPEQGCGCNRVGAPSAGLLLICGVWARRRRD